MKSGSFKVCQSHFYREKLRQSVMSNPCYCIVMKSPFRLFMALPLLLPALAARATDDMQIYSDRLNNMIESN